MVPIHSAKQFNTSSFLDPISSDLYDNLCDKVRHVNEDGSFYFWVYECSAKGWRDRASTNPAGAVTITGEMNEENSQTPPTV